MVKSVPTPRSSKRAQDSDERSLVQQQVKTSHSDPEQQHTQSHDAATGRETQRVCVFVRLSQISLPLCVCHSLCIAKLLEYVYVFMLFIHVCLSRSL